MHIFSTRGSLECVLVHWRDFESKSKTELKLFHDGASCAALTLMGISRRRPRIAFADCRGRARRPLRCCFCVPAYPRWKITLFAAQGLLMSAQHCFVFVLDFQSWRVESEEDKSKLRSTQVEVRGPTLPATRSNHQVGYGDNNQHDTLADRSLDAK